MFTFQIMIGYFNDPEATKSVMDEDGFLNTGDIGHIDEDSFVRISDRQKNIIIGENGVNVRNILDQIEVSFHCILVTLLKKTILYSKRYFSSSEKYIKENDCNTSYADFSKRA